MIKDQKKIKRQNILYSMERRLTQVKNNVKKSTIIFIHGFGKSSNNWNITEKDKIIGIESEMNKSCNTVMVNLQNGDYLFNISDVCTQIYQELEESTVLKTNIIIVTHSYGSFYGLQMAHTWPKIFNKLILLDPTIKTADYYLQLLAQQVTSKDEHSNSDIEFKQQSVSDKEFKQQSVSANVNIVEKKINEAKILHFDQFIDHTKLYPKIRVIIHANIDSKEPKLEKIVELNKYTNKNVGSRLIVHVDVSHMIHYKIPGVIIDSILSII
jgi:hypothetical protein